MASVKTKIKLFRYFTIEKLTCKHLTVYYPIKNQQTLAYSRIAFVRKESSYVKNHSVRYDVHISRIGNFFVNLLTIFYSLLLIY